MLATNESKYPWMDEGFTTYAQALTLDHLYEKNATNPVANSYMGYAMLARSKDQEPLTTHADHYKKNRTYGISVYSKGAVFLHQLSYIVGKEAFQRGMLDYYNTWRFKHPTPDDFKRVMERASGLELDWYSEQFIGTINTIDYAVGPVEKNGKSTKVTLEKKGDMPMPLDIKVTLTDGTVEWHYIPLRIMRGEKGPDLAKFNKVHKDWGWAYPTYDLNLELPLKKIEKIEIDPSRRLADIYPLNNVFPEEDKNNN
jgi:aminopeptidase N